MKRTFFIRLGLVVLGVALAFTPAFSQQEPLGKIHGHITDPGGLPKTVGTVSLSQDAGKTSKYSFPVSAAGNYAGEAKVGTYMVIYRMPETPADKIVDGINNVKIVSGTDIVQDIDMSRKEFLARLTPEQRKQIEEYAKKNAETMKANESIRSLNDDLSAVRQKIKDKKFEEAEALMLRDTAVRPESGLLWVELGVAQAGQKKVDEAIKSFKMALDLDSSSKKPNPEIGGVANSGLGEIYARSARVPEANAAFEAAAKADPTKAGVYLSNQAIIFYQLYSSGAQGADFAAAQVAAADRAIQVQPSSAILYYLKGNGLVQKATIDPKTQRVVLPAGCAEAFQQYLALAPDGKFASDVKDILGSAGQKINSSFKAGKK